MRFVRHSTNRGFAVTVIKTLDHWPDFGSDMDLFTNAHPNEVSWLMAQSFNARIAPRSWGDHLANKWNFLLPGLPEPIEIHIGRLGQTGEQVALASSLNARTANRSRRFPFSVPSIADRLIISTLQRMYRHFYFRLCDVLDTAGIADAGLIDYHELAYVGRLRGYLGGSRDLSCDCFGLCEDLSRHAARLAALRAGCGAISRRRDLLPQRFLADSDHAALCSALRIRIGACARSRRTAK